MNVAIGIALIAVIATGVVFMINGIGIFAPSRRPRVQDDPEVIMGMIAHVVMPIGVAAAGTVSYTLEGTRHNLAARSLDGSAIGAGEDVVIERIEEGTALVERWEAVEGRI